MIRALLVFAVMLLNGCDFALVKPPAEPTLAYQLEISEVEQSSTSPIQGLLYIPNALASPQIDSSKMLFIRTPGVVENYKFALWSEPPTSRLTTIFARELERSRAVEMATRRNGPAHADFLLDSEVTEFFHEAISEPGSFKVSVNFTLIDIKSRKVLAKRSISEEVKLDSFDAAGAARAASLASRQVVIQLVEFFKNFSAKS